jgi:hypothetical protein
MSRFRRGVENVTNQLGKLDDVTQSAIREHLLRVPTDGSELPQDARLRGLRQVLANTVHAPRAGSGIPTRGGFEDNRAGVAAMLAMRGIQAGGVTAAGLGLAKLTDAFNQQTDTQLPM